LFSFFHILFGLYAFWFKSVNDSKYSSPLGRILIG
jgi:hypothetical protein